jgi:probable HAF family extracellular repeat protein
MARGINSSGDIVGAYINADGDQHSFLLQNSSFSTIDVPGAILTVARAINDEGDIAGFYFDIQGPHGFVFSNGSFRTIDFPGEPRNSLSGINSAGSVVGGFAGFGNGFLLRNGIF